MKLRVIPRDGADQPPQRSEPRSAILRLGTVVVVEWSQDPVLIFKTISSHFSGTARTK